MRVITTIAISALLFQSACAAASTGAPALSSDASSRPATRSSAEVMLPTIGENCPNPYGGDCLGPLKAGTYETIVFEPTLTYSVPDDTWANLEDLPGNFLLLRPQDPQAGVVGGSYIGVYQNVQGPALNCDEAPEPGVGDDPEQLVAYYQGVPGLQVSDPVEVNVGGLRGYQLDFAVKRNDALCSFDGYPGTGLIIGNGVSDLYHVALPQIDVRLILLSWKRGNVTIEITNVKKQYPAAKWRSIVQPIVDSFQFG